MKRRGEDTCLCIKLACRSAGAGRQKAASPRLTYLGLTLAPYPAAGNVTMADAPQGKAAARATSPGHAGHKRSRDLGETPSAKQTPSKLRTAFERHIGRN